jgi:hypothetical protein
LAEKLTHLEQSFEPCAERTTVGVQTPHWLAIPGQCRRQYPADIHGLAVEAEARPLTAGRALLKRNRDAVLAGVASQESFRATLFVS